MDLAEIWHIIREYLGEEHIKKSANSDAWILCNQGGEVSMLDDDLLRLQTRYQLNILHGISPHITLIMCQKSASSNIF